MTPDLQQQLNLNNYSIVRQYADMLVSSDTQTTFAPLAEAPHGAQ